MRSSRHEVLAAEITRTAAGLHGFRSSGFRAKFRVLGSSLADLAGLLLHTPTFVWVGFPQHSMISVILMRFDFLDSLSCEGLGHPLIVGCGAVLRTCNPRVRSKGRQKHRNTPLRSKLEQRLSLSSAMEFSASEPSKQLSFTTP